MTKSNNQIKPKPTGGNGGLGGDGKLNRKDTMYIIPKSYFGSIEPNIKQWMPVPEGEKEILWVVDPSKYFFCRTRIFYSARRDSKPDYKGNGLLLGWSVLDKSQGREPSGFYQRRYFYLQAVDLQLDCVYYLDGCHPAEGVTPNTVKPGVWGVHLQPKFQGNKHQLFVVGAKK